VTVSSEYLQAGYLGDLTTLRTLQLLCRFSLNDAARYCGVSPHTFRRWRSDRVPPRSAVRLLAIRAGYLPWPDWAGWEMHNGLLFPPGMTRGGIAPGDVLSMPYLHALIAEQRRELQERRKFVDEAPAKAHAV
jgi:hypothetical protein